MICSDCHGDESVCLLCDGHGNLCDICGEATGEPGLDVCEACRAEEGDE